MGHHGRAVRLGLAVALFSVTVGAGSSADAHMGTDWLDGRWGTSSLNFTFTASVPPNSPFPNRDRIREGFQEWPSKTGSPTVTFDTSTLNWTPSTPCSYGFGVNGIHYYAIDGQYGTRARTSRCFQTPGSGVLVNVQTTFDSGETWWTYDSTSGLSTTYLDMESVAAHEAGHAIGWGAAHFTGSTLCPYSSSHHTMCGGTPYGTSWKRTLATHDIHTMESNY